MDASAGPGARGISQAVACAAIGVAGGAAIGAYSWLAFREAVPRPGAPAIEATLTVVVLGAVGFAAGTVSRGWTAAIVVWLAALAGAALAYGANYTLDPTWPSSETPFWLSLAAGALISLPFIGAGYLLAVIARQRLRS